MDTVFFNSLMGYLQKTSSTKWHQNQPSHFTQWHAQWVYPLTSSTVFHTVACTRRVGGGSLVSGVSQLLVICKALKFQLCQKYIAQSSQLKTSRLYCTTDNLPFTTSVIWGNTTCKNVISLVLALLLVEIRENATFMKPRFNYLRGSKKALVNSKIVRLTFLWCYRLVPVASLSAQPILS